MTCSAGVDAPDGIDGVDLSAAVETGEEPDRPPVVSDNLVPRWGEGTEFRMVRDGDHKYVHFRDAPELLFDLASDPPRDREPGADRERRRRAGPRRPPGVRRGDDRLRRGRAGDDPV